jgi:DNA repair exonuclease SbcCD nuclease subunit
MRIIVCSDAHLDARTAGVERFDEIAESFRQAVWHAVEPVPHADLFVFCGDLCDPDDGRDVLRASAFAVEMATTLSANHVPSLWLAGNHDVVKDGQTTTLEPLLYLGDGNVQVAVREPLLLQRGEHVDVLALPYSPTAYDAEEAVRRAEERAREHEARLVIFSHLMLPGMHLGSESGEMARGKDRNFPLKALNALRDAPALVVSGHYHRAQRTEDGIRVVGALARLTFGEETNAPGFLVVEL